MAIALLNIAPADVTTTGGVRVPGTSRNGADTIVPLGTAAFNENEQLRVPILNTEVSDFQVGTTVVITTNPNQFQGEGVVTAVGTAVGTHTDVTVEIDNVIVARNTVGLDFIILTAYTTTATVVTRTPARSPSGTGTYTAAQSGFVQAVYTGNDLSSNAHERGLMVSFGPSGNTTTYQLRAGVALPEGAFITNSRDERFNILINNG